MADGVNESDNEDEETGGAAVCGCDAEVPVRPKENAGVRTLRGGDK